MASSGGVPMAAAAPVSMCPPPAEFMLGVNRPWARNLVCARARAPCVLSPRGSFRLDVPLRNRDTLFAPSALGLPLGMHGALFFLIFKAEYTKPKRSAQQPPSDPQPKIRQARPGNFHASAALLLLACPHCETARALCCLTHPSSSSSSLLP